MKGHRAVVLASVLAIVLLLGPNLALADGPPSPPSPHGPNNAQNYTMGLGGLLVNVAQQHLRVDGGQLQPGSTVNGLPLTVDKAHVNLHLDARVNGLNVTGNANFKLDAQSPAGTVHIDGKIVLSSAIPALGLPLSCNQTTLVGCTSEVPGLYAGNASLTIKIDAPPSPPGQGPPSPHSPPSPPVKVNIPMLIESPYLNPFGGPIVIESADVLLGASPAIQIITSYQHAESDWSNVTVAGVVTDSTGTPIGQFSQTASLSEDLFHGTERDHGSLSLFGFDPNGQYSVFNSNGNFRGTSTIPTAGSFPCDIPPLFPAGTCTATGSLSSGTFNLNGGQGPGHVKLQGTYNNVWTIPAYGFEGVVQVTVSKG